MFLFDSECLILGEYNESTIRGTVVARDDVPGLLEDGRGIDFLIHSLPQLIRCAKQNDKWKEGRINGSQKSENNKDLFLKKKAGSEEAPLNTWVVEIVTNAKEEGRVQRGSLACNLIRISNRQTPDKKSSSAPVGLIYCIRSILTNATWSS